MSKDLLTTGSGFSLQPANLNEAMRFAEILAASDMVPKHYKGKPQDALVAMMMGSELGLNPLQSLQNIANINGKPSVYGDAALALVQNHPVYGGVEEEFDEATMTATCTAWRKGEKKKHVVTFSVQDAKDAGLWGKQGPWTNYKKRMLQMRARGFALRDKFADVLAGLILREEAEDFPQSETDLPPLAKGRQEIEMYSDDQFKKNLPAWKKLVATGKSTPEQIIDKVSSKATLTDDQKKEILGLKKEEPVNETVNTETGEVVENADA